MAVGMAGCTGDEDDGNGDDGDEAAEDNESDAGNETETDDGTDGDGNETSEGSENETDADNESAEMPEEDAGGTGIMLFVENENGEPVAQGVSITIEPVEESETGGITYSIESEEALEGGGEYEQELVETGDYRITAEGEAFETVEEEVTVEDGEMVEVTLTLDGAPAEGEGDDAESEEEDEEDAENETEGNETAEGENETDENATDDGVEPGNETADGDDNASDD